MLPKTHRFCPLSWTEAEKNLFTDICVFITAVPCQKKKNAYHPKGQRLEVGSTLTCKSFFIPQWIEIHAIFPTQLCLA